MPSLNRENLANWQSQAGIDYFTHFVKAWIPFNAWYRASFDVNSDRQAIDLIKQDDNSFRDRLIYLLEGGGNEGVAFRSEVGKLHYAMQRVRINDKGSQVTFANLVVENNTQLSESFERNRTSYEASIDPKNRKQIKVRVVAYNGTVKLDYQQTNGYDVADLQACSDFPKLTSTQQSLIIVCYETINPRKPTNLLTSDKKNKIEIGDYNFVDDSDLVCKGIIEVLYILRNALFHGEIVPNQDTNRVYEAGYHILHTLIQAL